MHLIENFFVPTITPILSCVKSFSSRRKNNLSKFNQNGLYEVVFSFNETVETIDEDENITFEDVLVKYSYYFFYMGFISYFNPCFRVGIIDKFL